MIRHVWSVLCGKSVIDRDTNNVSILEVMERIEFTYTGLGPFPQGAPISFELITLWARRDPNVPVEGEMRVRLLAPDGRELSVMPASRLDLITHQRLRQRLRLEGILLAGSGWYDWEVAYRTMNQGEWTVAALVPLEIVVRRAEEPPGGVQPAATTGTE